MATKKITALPTAGTLAGNELAELVQGGDSKKATLSLIGLVPKTLAELSTQISDADIARTDATQTFTGAQQTGVTTLTDATTIAVDAALNNAFKVTITANRILGNPTNAVEGMSWTVRLIQDGVGSHSLTFGANYDFGDDNSAPVTGSDGAAKERIFSFYAVSATKIIAVDAVGIY